MTADFLLICNDARCVYQSDISLQCAGCLRIWNAGIVIFAQRIPYNSTARWTAGNAEKSFFTIPTAEFCDLVFDQ